MRKYIGQFLDPFTSGVGQRTQEKNGLMRARFCFKFGLGFGCRVLDGLGTAFWVR